MKLTCHRCNVDSTFDSNDMTNFVKDGYVDSGWLKLDFSQGLGKEILKIFLCNMCADNWRAELIIMKKELIIAKKEYDDKVKSLEKSFLGLENVKQLFAYHVNIKESNDE